MYPYLSLGAGTPTVFPSWLRIRRLVVSPTVLYTSYSPVPSHSTLVAWVCNRASRRLGNVTTSDVQPSGLLITLAPPTISFLSASQCQPLKKQRSVVSLLEQVFQVQLTSGFIHHDHGKKFADQESSDFHDAKLGLKTSFIHERKGN